MEKIFLVTLTSVWDTDRLTAGTVKVALNDAFRSTDVISTVVKHDPKSAVEHYRIPAVKRVRELLGCSLRDGIFLLDTADEKGVAKWGTVEVIRETKGSSGAYGSTFKVIDNS